MMAFQKMVIWAWSAMVVAACMAILSNVVTFYPGAPSWVNVAGSVILLIVAIGFGLRERWAFYAAIPVILGTTVVDILLGLHGGLSVAWPGIALGLVGWLALAAQYALRKKGAAA